jgi:hypothetical protein
MAQNGLSDIFMSYQQDKGEEWFHGWYRQNENDVYIYFPETDEIDIKSSSTFVIYQELSQNYKTKIEEEANRQIILEIEKEVNQTLTPEDRQKINKTPIQEIYISYEIGFLGKVKPQWFYGLYKPFGGKVYIYFPKENEIDSKPIPQVSFFQRRSSEYVNQITQLANDKIELEIEVRNKVTYPKKRQKIEQPFANQRTQPMQIPEPPLKIQRTQRMQIPPQPQPQTMQTLEQKKAQVIRQRCQTMQSSLNAIKPISGMLSSIYISYDIKTVSGTESKWFLGFYYILNKSSTISPQTIVYIFFPETIEIAKYYYSNLQEFIKKSDEYRKQLSLKGKQPDTTYKTQENSDLAVCAIAIEIEDKKQPRKSVSTQKKPMYRTTPGTTFANDMIELHNSLTLFNPTISTDRTRPTQRIEGALQTLQKTVDGLNDSQLYQNCQSLRQNLNFSQSTYPLERVIDYTLWDPMILNILNKIIDLRTYSNMFYRLRTSFVPKIQSLTSKGIPKDVYTQYLTQYKIDVKNRSMKYLPSQIVGDSSSFIGKKFRKITGLSPQAECTSAGVTNLTSSIPYVPFKVTLQPDIKFVERFSPLYKYGDPGRNLCYGSYLYVFGTTVRDDYGAYGQLNPRSGTDAYGVTDNGISESFRVGQLECEHIAHFKQMMVFFGNPGSSWNTICDKILQLQITQGQMTVTDQQTIKQIYKGLHASLYDISFGLFNQIKSNRDVINVVNGTWVYNKTHMNQMIDTLYKGNTMSGTMTKNANAFFSQNSGTKPSLHVFLEKIRMNRDGPPNKILAYNWSGGAPVDLLPLYKSGGIDHYVSNVQLKVNEDMTNRIDQVNTLFSQLNTIGFDSTFMYCLNCMIIQQYLLSNSSSDEISWVVGDNDQILEFKGFPELVKYNFLTLFVQYLGSRHLAQGGIQALQTMKQNKLDQKGGNECPSQMVDLSQLTLHECTDKNLRRNLLLQTHPDKNRACVKEATQKFQWIQNFYERGCQEYNDTVVKNKALRNLKGLQTNIYQKVIEFTQGFTFQEIEAIPENATVEWTGQFDMESFEMKLNQEYDMFVNTMIEELQDQGVVVETIQDIDLDQLLSVTPENIVQQIQSLSQVLIPNAIQGSQEYNILSQLIENPIQIVQTDSSGVEQVLQNMVEETNQNPTLNAEVKTLYSLIVKLNQVSTQTTSGGSKSKKTKKKKRYANNLN